MSIQFLKKYKTLEAQGENITLNGTAEAPFKKFVVSGNSWQETRSGKNKFNVSDLVNRSNISNRDTSTSSFDVLNTWGTTIMETGKIKKYLKSNTKYKMIADVTLLNKPSDLSSSANANALIVLYKTGNMIEMLSLADKAEKNNWEVNTKKTIKKAFTTPSDLTDYNMLSYNYYVQNVGAQGSFKYENVMILEDTETDESFEPYGVMPSTEFSSELRNCGDNVNEFDGNLNKGYWNNTTKLLTATDSLIFKSFSINLKAGVYVLSCSTNINITRAFTDYNAGESKGGVIFSGNAMNVNSYIINLTEKTNLYISVRRSDNTSWLDTDLLKLEKGTKATPYSKFGQGNLNFKICNKNFVSSKFLDWKSNSVDNYKLLSLKLKKGKTYKFWAELIGTKMKTINFGIAKSGNNYNEFASNTIFLINYQTGDIVNLDITVDESYTEPKLVCYCANEEEFNNIFKNYNIQLEENTKTNYAEHKEQSFTFPLAEGQVLYKDDYLADDGIHHKRKQRVLDGTEAFTLKHTNNGLYYFACGPKWGQDTSKQTYLSSHYKRKTSWSAIEQGIWFDTNLIICDDSYLDGSKTVGEFKNELAQQKANGTPVTIEYELAEEEIEPYNAEQQAVYEQIKKTAKSYEGITHIFSEDEISPIFNVAYKIQQKKITKFI